MKKIIFLSLFAFFLFTNYCFSTEIVQIPLSELQEKADLIILAQVTGVTQKDNNVDEITIKIDSCLKGKTEKKELSFLHHARGGLKDFGPELKLGDTGVFFLNNRNEVRKAYVGSIALFPWYIFTLRKDSQ